MRSMWRAMLVAAVVALPTTVRAQAAPLVGKWELELTVGMRVEDGVPQSVRGKGRLEVVEQGDSLVATLAVEPVEGMPPRPPSRFAAKKGTGPEYAFTARSEATLNTNGEERKAVVISTWRLVVAGDALSGSVAREIEGMSMGAMPAQPVTGTRVH